MLATFYRNVPNSKVELALFYLPKPSDQANVHGRARRLANSVTPRSSAIFMAGCALIEDFPKVRELVQPLRASTTNCARASGALDALRSHRTVDGTRVAALGFCIGETLALELGTSSADLRSVVGFHAGLSTTAPQGASSMRCRVLVCTGADDPSVPLDQRVAFENEMKVGGVDWTMHVYGGVIHAFTIVTQAF